jgi:site-specific recombinase XerD
MYLVPPDPRKRQWDIRIRNWDGRIVRISGDRDRDTAVRIGQRIDMLVRAKINGDPPPYELQTWIDQMAQKLADRLVELGLLDRRRVEQHVKLLEHADMFEKVVAARRTNSAVHAKIQANRVRRILKAMKANTFTAITEDDVLGVVGGWGLSVASRRHYLVAIKDFCKWGARTGRATKNQLADLKPPGQYECPEVERVPLSVKQFQALSHYLDTFERYKGQQASWTAYDRLLIYWTAVKTAYRKTEMSTLRVRNLHFDTKPPCISIRAGDAKTKAAGEVPIPADLAAALQRYVRNRDDDEWVFRFPATSRSVVRMFRRDLTGAGIKWNFGEDDPRTIDFHTTRATAITWWLDVDGLTPKRVQILARLKTLALVAKYSRNLRLSEFGWLNKGPKLVRRSCAKRK